MSAGVLMRLLASDEPLWWVLQRNPSFASEIVGAFLGSEFGDERKYTEATSESIRRLAAVIGDVCLHRNDEDFAMKCEAVAKEWISLGKGKR